jgi:hypothetical protein
MILCYTRDRNVDINPLVRAILPLRKLRQVRKSIVWSKHKRLRTYIIQAQITAVTTKVKWNLHA